MTDRAWGLPCGSVAVIIVSEGRETVVDAISSVRLSGSPIVVVDASPDGRASLIVNRAFGPVGFVDGETWSDSMPLAILSAPGAGISEARNHALANTRCDLLAFVDDDAVASEGWLEALCRGLGTATVAGGPVLADAVPAWCQNRYRAMLPELRVASVLRGCDPIGANFLVRRRRALELGGFREDLGLCTRLRRRTTNEDTEFFRRVRAFDGAPAMVSAASVFHPVDGSRSTLRWLVRRSFYQGRSDARLSAGVFRFRALAQIAVIHRDRDRRGWKGWVGEAIAQRSWAFGVLTAPPFSSRIPHR